MSGGDLKPARAEAADIRIPRLPKVLPPYLARHPWQADTAISLLCLVSALGLWLAMTDSAPGGWIAAPLTPYLSGAAAGTLMFRRRFPILTVGVCFALLALAYPSDIQLGLGPLLVALYSVAVYRSLRAGWISLVVVEAALALSLLVANLLPATGVLVLAQVVTDAIAVVIPVLIGSNVGSRRRYVTALRDRAYQLARERDQLHAIATVAERSRIAREMHDIVSHSLTVMVTLADGSLAQLRTDPERSGAALQQAAETGRHALDDMRRMLGVLSTGTDDIPFGSPPTLDDLAPLIDTMRDAGLPIAFTQSAIIRGDSALQLTIYRIVQECLTNVLRHAPTANSVSVRVEQTGDQVHIIVTNGPPRKSGLSTNPRRFGTGNGLVGMRARVSLYGGSLRSGPTRLRGWETVATLTLDDEGANDVSASPVQAGSE